VSGTGTEDFGDNRIEIDFSETVHIDGPIEVFLKGQLPFYSEPDITLVAAMLRFSGDIPDDRAEWHHNYTPIESWMQAHILRKVNGWSIKKTAERIRAERDMPQMLGFFEDEPKKGAHVATRRATRSCATCGKRRSPTGIEARSPSSPSASSITAARTATLHRRTCSFRRTTSRSKSRPKTTRPSGI